MSDQPSRPLPDPEADALHFSQMFQAEAEKATVPELKAHWQKRAQDFASRLTPKDPPK
jgi:hypothetical protein